MRKKEEPRSSRLRIVTKPLFNNLVTNLVAMITYFDIANIVH